MEGVESRARITATFSPTPPRSGERISPAAVTPEPSGSFFELRRPRISSDITDPRVRAAVAATNDGGRFAGPLPLLRHDGSRFHADISVTRFTDAVGQVRVCAFVRDVAAADRRALEAKVQHAQKLESLGVLAGGIAHDFNNLLVGILGNASLALTDLPDESPLREIVADIETTALRAADLTNRMLAYSGKGRFVVNQVDVNALVREMAQRCRR